MSMLISCVLICSCFTGCNNNEKTIAVNNNTSQNLNIKTKDEVLAEILKSQISCFTEIAYASNDKVILNGTIGLIVYDLINKKISRAIDLTSINMNHIQGDTVTIFEVSKDGSQILMYNDPSSDDKYLYDVESDSLEHTSLKGFTDKYIHLPLSDSDIHNFTDKYLEENDDIDMAHFAKIDDNTICILEYPEDLNKISELKVMIINKDSGLKNIYNIFD